MTDLVEWLRDVWRDSDPRLEDFSAFLEKMQKIYRDIDWKLNRVIMYMTNFHQETNKLVRVYTHRIEPNWRAVEWHPQYNKIWYQFAWSGLRIGPKSEIMLLTPKDGKFDSMEEVFDQASISEVKLEMQKAPTAAATSIAKAVRRIMLIRQQEMQLPSIHIWAGQTTVARQVKVGQGW